MSVHNHMSKNEYVQIDDEKTILDAMDRLTAIGKESSETSIQFNSLLGQKQEFYNLAKILAKELIHDLHDLGTFVKQSDAPKKKVLVKRAPVKKKQTKRATPKRPVKKSTSSMQKLKANMKKAKSKK